MRLLYITKIYFLTFSFSSPQLPAPCSSSFGRFQRPLMPSSKSTLTFGEQLQAHEQQLLQIRQDLEEHQQSPPSRGTKGSALQAYTEKHEFLTFEIMRYETYILTLRTKNAHDAQDTENLGQTKINFLIFRVGNAKRKRGHCTLHSASQVAQIIDSNAILCWYILSSLVFPAPCLFRLSKQYA